jgi:hypothetical protein
MDRRRTVYLPFPTKICAIPLDLAHIMKTSAFSLRACVLASLFALTAAGPAQAEEWRFCVGVSPSTHETIITDVFASAADSAQIEHRFEAFFRARRGKTLTFQCPRGAAERYAALNAQTAALQFNRQMGFSVNGLPAAEAVAVAGGAAF